MSIFDGSISIFDGSKCQFWRVNFQFLTGQFRQFDGSIWPNKNWLVEIEGGIDEIDHVGSKWSLRKTLRKWILANWHCSRLTWHFDFDGSMSILTGQNSMESIAGGVDLTSAPQTACLRCLCRRHYGQPLWGFRMGSTFCVSNWFAEDLIQGNLLRKEITREPSKSARLE